MTSIKLPYVMRLAWETNTTVSTMRCHKLVAEPLVRIFQAALDHYGMEKIRGTGAGPVWRLLQQPLHYRRKSHIHACLGHRRGHGSDRNGLNVSAPKAVLSGPEYAAFWQFVEAEGAVSLGRSRDYDWMHFQFATL